MNPPAPENWNRQETKPTPSRIRPTAQTGGNDMTHQLRKTIALRLVAIASGASGYAITEQSSSGNVKVQFVDYERFTDIEVSKLTSDRQKAALLKDIAKDFQKQAGRYLPDGYTV